MKPAITRILSSVLTSRWCRDLMRKRRRKGVPTIDYFHQIDDPYSHLLVQLLEPLRARYGLRLRAHLVSPPDDANAPERERLRQFGLRDARVLADGYGLDFPGQARLPSAEDAAAAAARLTPWRDDMDFPAKAFSVGDALWGSRPLPEGLDAVTDGVLAEGDALRRKLGHYLGGMIHFEGEWYWGVDRLNHLEERLSDLGFDSAPKGTPPLAPYRGLRLAPFTPPAKPPVIEAWYSFRSPYSYIAIPRLRRLAEHYGADLRLRYILPMIMRGLPVPRAKTIYIMLDTKREADRVGLPFGTMVEPVGAPIERTLAVLHHAVPMGLGAAFSERAFRAIFAEGIDLGSDKALYRVAADAGLSKADVDAGLRDESWREAAEANRKALFDAGLWGAPTYRVNGGEAHWGQDRLWALENDLLRAIAAG